MRLFVFYASLKELAGASRAAQVVHWVVIELVLGHCKEVE